MIGSSTFLRTVAPATALAVWLAGCASLGVSDPTNQPLAGDAAAAFASSRQDPSAGDDVMVGLAFSGGGTRAAAFAHGVLQEIDQTTARTRSGTHSLLDRVGFVSGVSGGAVTAAYFGLKKREALTDFREKFLIRNAEESISTNISAVNLMKGLGGGVNDVRTFSRWLNDNLYNGATFADFRKAPGPQVWINASDIYNRTPFIYGETTFGALCSDLAVLSDRRSGRGLGRGADRVHADGHQDLSQAVHRPAVAGDGEGAQQPERAADVEVLRRRARELRRRLDQVHQAPRRRPGRQFRPFRLHDRPACGAGAVRAAVGRAGGAAASRDRSSWSMPAGRRPATGCRPSTGRAGWSWSTPHPTRRCQASVRASYTAFQTILSDYQRQLVTWRCGLSPELRKRYGAGPNWNCQDIKLSLTRVAFEQLGPARAKALSAVDTRFKLPVEQVDAVIAAGRDALAANPQYREFLRGLGARPSQQPVPEAPPLPSEPPPTPVATAPSLPFPFPPMPSSFAAQ